MKNLYIYQLNKNGAINKEVWKDVKVTRDKGQIVTKRSAEYKLSHGNYKFKDNLDKIQIGEFGFPEAKIEYTEYISFDLEEMTDEIKQQMIKPFIENCNKNIKELQNQILDLEELKNKFKNL